MVEAAKKYYPFDRNLAFAEDLALTGSDVVQFASADVVLDLGEGRFDGVLVIDPSVLAIDGNDELYTFILQGSHVAAFDDDIENLAILQLGAVETRLGGALDSIIGRYEVPFANAQAGVEWRYVRLNVLHVGATTASTFSAWISPRSEW